MARMKCPSHLEVLDDSSGVLICPGGCRYAVKEGIPRFVSSTLYADAFGTQWNRYRLTQVDSYTGIGISERRARRNLGDKLWGQLEGQHVLEAGCGAGRFTEVLRCGSADRNATGRAPRSFGARGTLWLPTRSVAAPCDI